MSLKNPFGNRIGLTVKALVKQINVCFDHHDIDITVNQMVLLNMLNNQDGLIQHTLAETLNKDKSAILRQINCLENKHYLVRVPDKQDKRRKVLMLTKPGLEILEKALNVENEVLKTILDNIDNKHLEIFYDVLEQIHENTQEFSIC